MTSQSSLIADQSEIPADIMRAAEKAFKYGFGLRYAVAIEAIAKVINTERQRCLQIAEAHARQCESKINRKRSDFDNALFESAASEALSIAATIRALSKEESNG